MKNIILILATTAFIAVPIFAQDNVGIGTLTPNAKAILDLTSPNKGFLAPRMTTAQRLAIAPTFSEEGLMVFDTDTKHYFFWNGVQWVPFPGPQGFNTSLTFNNNILSITDGGGTLSVPLNFINNDNDSTNELITSMVFDANGNILTIEEGGNTWSTTINVNDADSDPTNELQTLTLSGNILAISGGNSVDLSPFVNTDNQTLTLSGTQLSISNGNTVDLSAISSADAWKLTGNAGTNVTTNYIGTSDNVGLSIRTNATERIRITAAGLVGIGATAPAVRLAIGGNGVNAYATDVWVENNMHVQGNETLVQGGRGRLRVGTAWSYVGLYADGSSTGALNDLVLGASSGVVRIGPDFGGQDLRIPNLGGSGNVPVFADNNGILYKGTGSANAPVQIHSITFPTLSSADPVPLQDFTTNIPVSSYDCVVADFSTAYDINENGRRMRKIWLYQHGDGTWHLSINFGAHSNANPNLTNTDLKIVCFTKSMVNWNGNARTLNNNY